MATGHLNPGYRNVISQLNRAGYAIDNNVPLGSESMRELHNVSMNNNSLEDIRNQAREAWGGKGPGQTSYQDHYGEKLTKLSEFTTARPTSAGRKNKPHPPMVFLTNRLHNCPGYHNPDTTLGREPYQIDMTVSPTNLQQRAKLKSKFIGRPSTAALHQYKSDLEDLEFSENPLQRKVAEALMSRTNYEDVIGPLHELNYDGIQVKGGFDRSYRPPMEPSLHRFLKNAGPMERSNLNLRTQSAYATRTQPSYGLNFGAALDDMHARRRRDIENMGRVTVTTAPLGHRTRRGDFLMHPEWPPSFTAHRLNGLSSVDVPYSSNQR